MEKSKDTLGLVELFGHYEKMVERNSGVKAELRRVAEPHELLEKPSFYRLMAGKGTGEGWQHVAFFMPYVKHKAGAESLGRQLSKAKISEMRLFQVLRSNSPNDLIQLRRLIQQIEPTLDWEVFGNSLYWWKQTNTHKQKILQDYFLTSTPEEKSKPQGSPK